MVHIFGKHTNAGRDRLERLVVTNELMMQGDVRLTDRARVLLANVYLVLLNTKIHPGNDWVLTLRRRALNLLSWSELKQAGWQEEPPAPADKPLTMDEAVENVRQAEQKVDGAMGLVRSAVHRLTEEET